MARQLDLPRDFQALRALSARVGADSLLVQGPGGNTSIKHEGVLWVKASGTWLANALDKDIFVPVRLDPLLEAVASGDERAEKAADFVLAEQNPSGLRPSIETTFHAVMPQRVVVHVHCVETISVAVRRDAREIVAERLEGLNWAFAPYARPGLPLTRAILQELKPETDMLVLGNHGLVVAADAVDAAEALLAEVSGRLRQPVRVAPPADLDALRVLAASSPYHLPRFEGAHAAATDAISCRCAVGGSLYPDHVIFLGPGSVLARADETAAGIAARAQEAGAEPPAAILFPGRGVLVREDATAGAEALALCLADVTARIPENTPLRYLSDVENAELLDWDAEKYRQAMARRGGHA
ncbi:MAG TPA: class II aldolase/adducin family protein [Mesorhizobium sp.]|jgi:rhamnose utilization protein RhaD (predicted bifunctional aldolase and dehydrogenase)|nr:class II aldolase/adducin family protein [Mesorhizobium sp.]